MIVIFKQLRPLYRGRRFAGNHRSVSRSFFVRAVVTPRGVKARANRRLGAAIGDRTGVCGEGCAPVCVNGCVADAPTDPNPPAEHEAAAVKLFGERLPMAIAYADLLMSDGVVRGLIGPREAPRIWDRHLLNCAAVAELVPMGARVIDVGSGAGLPGIVLAIARPGLPITLVEPLERRAIFLTEAVGALGLEEVTVLRARAEECAALELIDPAEVVTARAVAPLDRLAAWCLPLAMEGGRLLALKGDSAEEEAARNEAAIRRLGGGTPTIRRCGVGVVEPPVTVVEVARERAVSPTQTDRASKSAKARRKPRR